MQGPFSNPWPIVVFLFIFSFIRSTFFVVVWPFPKNNSQNLSLGGSFLPFFEILVLWTILLINHVSRLCNLFCLLWNQNFAEKITHYSLYLRLTCQQITTIHQKISLQLTIDHVISLVYSWVWR